MRFLLRLPGHFRPDTLRSGGGCFQAARTLGFELSRDSGRAQQSATPAPPVSYSAPNAETQRSSPVGTASGSGACVRPEHARRGKRPRHRTGCPRVATASDIPRPRRAASCDAKFETVTAGRNLSTGATKLRDRSPQTARVQAQAWSALETTSTTRSI